MQLYIYAKSGHSFGLENVRRASAIFNILKDTNPVLCTADYRAATFAKYNLNAPKGVGVDIIGNMPHVMERGDMLIYDDSNEASDTMKEHMNEFCTNIYKVGVDIPFDIIDPTYFKHIENKYEKAVFFADDDYANWFFELAKNGNKQEMPLLLGHYFFLGNDDILKNYFSDIIEDEEYEHTIKSTKYLLTSSIQAALESLASGNNPVYFKREDKKDIENLELLEKYNIPTVSGKTIDEIIESFNTVVLNYPNTNEIKQFDISKVKSEIEETLKKFEMIKPALDYKY